jgi:predicted amidohydrolase
MSRLSARGETNILKVRIALVQFEIAHGMPEKNIEKAETFIKEAASADAQVIIFPELFLTGSIEADSHLVDLDGTCRRRFQQLAQRYRIDIVTGSIPEGDMKGKYNRTYYINAQGHVLGKYDKINLWLTERKHFTAGKTLSVFATSYGTVGLTICWDLTSPELFRSMTRQGVEFVFCPSYWCTQVYGDEVKHDLLAETKHVDALCVTRAFENEIVFAYCNAAGKCNQSKEEFPKQLIGHSQITVPFKGALQRLLHNYEEMIIQEVDTAILQDAEALYKIREQLYIPQGKP